MGVEPMKAYLIILAIVLALPVVAAYQNPEACMITTMHGFLPDSDCDGVHDMVDNCIYTPNAAQYDTNRNGIGDACDMIIQDLLVEPSVLIVANGYFSLDVTLMNNQPVSVYGLDVKVENKDLDVNTITQIPQIRPGEAQQTSFLLKVPRCAAEKSYPLRVTVRYLQEGKEQVQQAMQDVKVMPGGLCDGEETNMENTLVDTFRYQELDVGSRTIIPIRITNMNEEAVSYQIWLEGFDNWGTYRIDPAPGFTLPAGSDATSYIAIELEEWAELGEQRIDVAIGASDGQAERFPITLYVRKPLTQTQNEQLKQALEVTLILVVLVLLIVGIIIAYKKINEEE